MPFPCAESGEIAHDIEKMNIKSRLTGHLRLWQDSGCPDGA